MKGMDAVKQNLCEKKLKMFPQEYELRSWLISVFSSSKVFGSAEPTPAEAALLAFAFAFTFALAWAFAAGPDLIKRDMVSI